MRGLQSPIFLAATTACYSCGLITAFAPQQSRRTYNMLPLQQEVISTRSQEQQQQQAEETTTNVNFEEWIADAPDEVTKWKPCPISDDGCIPSYVEGTLIRNGGAIWTAPNNNDEFSHIFDGFAKIHAYKIHNSQVECQSRFLQGSWYKAFLKKDQQSFPVGFGTGPVLDSTTQQPKLGMVRTIQALINSATIFDNTPVNIWDYSPHMKESDNHKKTISALTDAPPRTIIDFNTMDTISSSTMNPLASGAKGYELFVTAHPMYSQAKATAAAAGDGVGVDTYNVAIELGLQGPRVNLVRETSQGERSVVTSVPSTDGIPYLHSYGLSANYAMIVLQPLRLDPSPDRLLELGFLRAMQHVDQTRIVVVDLTSGDVVLDKYIDEKVYFYHSISQAEIVNDQEDGGGVTVSLRLCAYKTPDQITGEHQFMRLEQAKKGLEWRNKLHRGGKFCDINCNLLDQSVKVDWKDEIKQGYELPVTRYSRAYGSECVSVQHPRYVYAFGAFALGSQDYDNWGLFKFDLEENKVSSYYQQDSVYLSEPIFVPNPDGETEDDGVLLCQAFFGKESETKLLVFNARNMEVMATVSTGMRAPLDFHGAWIPN
jgi:carotenoid cleavage dioxygenase-like enzyme